MRSVWYNNLPEGVEKFTTGGAHGVNIYPPDMPRLSWFAIFFTFLYRLFLCVTVQTVESPDEWWQSTEVAYHMVFGKGHLPWEWEVGLRSVIFPGMLAVPFLLLKWLGLDSAWTIWFASRLLQAFVITAIDIFVFRLGALLDVELRKRTKKKLRKSSDPNPVIFVALKDVVHGRVLGRSAAYFAFLLSLSNWYMVFAGVRMYSSIMEALLVLITIQERNYVPFLLLTGFACAIRVTSGIVLLPFFFLHAFWVVQKRGIRGGIKHIIFWGVLLFVLILGFVIFADSMFYGRWVVTPLVFLHFNIVQNASRFFGELPWYFYLCPSLPALLGPHVLFIFTVPLVLWTDKTSRVVLKNISTLVSVILWTIICYSLIDHKENRFIAPVLPLCFVVIGFVLARWYDKHRTVRRLHLLFLLFNVVLALLAGYVYRRGPLDVMAEVRSGPKIARLDVLATCYTTPGHSFAHGKVDHLGLVACPVRLSPATGRPELTEDIMFRRYPKDYVTWKYDGVHTINVSHARGRRQADELRRTVAPKSAPLPDVMVMFRDTAMKIKEPFLDKYGYRLYRVFLHTPLAVAPYEDIYMEMWVRRMV